MNVLSIGNSFSSDATRNLHAISVCGGAPIYTFNLYIGGCSLETHYKNMLADAAAYEPVENGVTLSSPISIKAALELCEWDVITVQQVSHKSMKYETYQPYANELVAYVRKLAPKAKIYVHQTWAYEEGCERLINEVKYPTARDMLADIVKSYAALAEEIGADGIIPSGELMMRLVESGIPTIHRDTFHANLGVGRYALALLWYHILTGNSVLDNSFATPEGAITEEEIKIAKACVESF